MYCFKDRLRLVLDECHDNNRNRPIRRRGPDHCISNHYTSFIRLMKHFRHLSRHNGLFSIRRHGFRSFNSLYISRLTGKTQINPDFSSNSFIFWNFKCFYTLILEFYYFASICRDRKWNRDYYYISLYNRGLSID